MCQVLGSSAQWGPPPHLTLDHTVESSKARTLPQVWGKTCVYPIGPQDTTLMGLLDPGRRYTVIGTIRLLGKKAPARPG